jgi:hypothetical protein
MSKEAIEFVEQIAVGLFVVMGIVSIIILVTM